jgi:hypothetical protein
MKVKEAPLVNYLDLLSLKSNGYQLGEMLQAIGEVSVLGIQTFIFPLSMVRCYKN